MQMQESLAASAHDTSLPAPFLFAALEAKSLMDKYYFIAKKSSIMKWTFRGFMS